MQSGERAEISAIWTQYYQRLVRLCYLCIGPGHGSADASDLADSAFVDFCRMAVRNEFPQLQADEKVWSTLEMIARRKAAELWRKEAQFERALQGPLAPRSAVDTATPVDFASRKDYEQFLLSKLCPRDRRIAALKQRGLTNEEIAARLGIGIRNVERRLAGIRAHLQRCADQEED
jgi:RNA polymerase sigma factor (sigma-70 family)